MNIGDRLNKELRTIVDFPNIEFLELNLLYGEKCFKGNFKNILKKKYKVGSPEYKDCVMSKGKN